MRVLFLPRYGPLAGSSRYMTYDYIPAFEQSGICCRVSPLQDDHYLLDAQARARGETGMGRVRRLLNLAGAFLRRVFAVLGAWRFDVVVLEKDLLNGFPYGLEWLLFRLNPRVVVQYDEATHAYYGDRGGWRAWITRGKIDSIIRRAAHVVVWNDIMREYARALNPNVTVVSTGIDLARYRPKQDYGSTGRPLRVGWIGSRGGFDYLHMLDPVLAELARNYAITLYVVSSEAYSAPGVPVVNRRWSLKTEIDDLRAMDIGVMPLPESEWAAGKSGCKMLQYMGAGVPVVVSPVGINALVVDNETNGYLATTPESWRARLEALITDEALRAAFGQAGRAYVVSHNDQAENARTLIDLVRQVAGRQGALVPPVSS